MNLSTTSAMSDDKIEQDVARLFFGPLTPQGPDGECWPTGELCKHDSRVRAVQCFTCGPAAVTAWACGLVAEISELSQQIEKLSLAHAQCSQFEAENKLQQAELNALCQENERLILRLAVVERGRDGYREHLILCEAERDALCQRLTDVEEDVKVYKRLYEEEKEVYALAVKRENELIAERDAAIAAREGK